MSGNPDKTQNKHRENGEKNGDGADFLERKLNFDCVRFVIAASSPDISPGSAPTEEMTLEVSGSLPGYSPTT